MVIRSTLFGSSSLTPQSRSASFLASASSHIFSLHADAHIRRDLADCQLGGIEADILGLQHGAGFLLFVRDGVVSFLEGFSYDEPWPAEVKEFRVYAHQTI
jgi:hypothetical protein